MALYLIFKLDAYTEKPFPYPENAIEIVDVICKEGVALGATSTSAPATTTIKETNSAATMIIFDRFIMLIGAIVAAIYFL